ncbi:ABC transporter permease [Actinomadura chibensis]|nr:ABC transporter permease [Actinomadura chibensis]
MKAAAPADARRRSRAARVTGFVAPKVAHLMAVLSGLVVATFLLLHLTPGDPAVRVAGLNATPQRLADVRHDLGLDRPLLAQFASYIGDVARWRLGNSFQTGEPVSSIIAARLPVTLEIVVGAMALTFGIGIGIGVWMAAITREGRHRRVESGFSATTSLLGSIPEYVVGTVLVLVFAVWLGLLPVAGAVSWQGYVLPVLAVAFAPTAVLARIVRVETLDVLAQNYVRTARAKHLSVLRTYGLHVLPNSLTGALTVGGLIFASLLGGTVVVENVFAVPGLGSSLVQAVQVRDYPLVQVTVLVLGFSIVVVNLCVEAALSMLDRQSSLRRS